MPSANQLSTRFNELQESLRLKREQLKKQKGILDYERAVLDNSLDTLRDLNSAARDIADRELAVAIMYDYAPKLFKQIEDDREALRKPFERVSAKIDAQEEIVRANRQAVRATRRAIRKDKLSLFVCKVKQAFAS